MDDEGPIEEHATPSPSPPQEDLRAATEKVNISTTATYANKKFRSGNNAHRTWDSPYQRYLDLSSPRRSTGAEGKDKMQRIWTKLTGLGAPTPINTLERDNSNGASLSTTQPVQETIDSPSVKRQKLRQTNDQNEDEDTARRLVPYSNSEFKLRDDDILAVKPSQKNDSHGNLSPDAIQPRVAEFERVESLIHPPSPVLGSRRRRNGKHQADEVIHLVSDDGGSEDPIDLIQTRKQEHSPVGTDELAHRFMSKPGSIKRILRQPDTVKSRMRGPFMTAARKRPRSSSMDELREGSPISKARPTKRIAANLSSSSSGESRGHISPVKLVHNSSQATRQSPNKPKTTDGYVTKAKHIITSTGLSVERAVSGSFVYPSPAGDMHVTCVLRVHEVSHLLLPTDERGSILGQLAYLTVNLAKVNKVQIPKEKTHSIVSLFRSVEPGSSGGAKLHIEFGCRNDVQTFLKWAQMPRPDAFPLQVEEVPGDRLKREMDNLGSKATHGYVIRDADEKKPNQPDDIRLVEHNQEKRKQQQPKPKLIHALASPDTAHVRPRIKDAMRSPMPQQHAKVLDYETPQSTVVRQTRAKRKIRSPSPPPPDLWTEKNPNWPLQWQDSLIFPPAGKNRATVDKVDIPRLDEGQLLNDNLIIFYLRYLQHDLELRRPDLAERIYFHNTFFYEKLKPTKGSPGINYDSVKAWTTKVDLFKKDFIVVPINEFSHWYIAIIYNAPKLDTTVRASPAADSSVAHAEDLASKSDNDALKEGTEQMAKTSVNAAGEVTVGINHMSLEPAGSDSKLAVIEPSTMSRDAEGLVGSGNQAEELSFVSGAEPKKPLNKGNPRAKKHNPDEPKIITLDSLGSGHSPACRNLKDYLIKELKDKKGVHMPDPGSLTMTAKGIPTQKNYCDCGVYLLGYVARFLHDPDAFIRTLLLHEDIEWDIDAPVLRNDIRKLLFKLQAEQIARENERVRAKKEAARIKRNRQSRPPSIESNEAPASAGMTHSEANQLPISPTRPAVEKGVASGPFPVALAQESIEGSEITSAVITSPKEADITILDEHHPKTPIRPAVSPNISNRSASPTTELEIETPRAMPSIHGSNRGNGGNGGNGGSPQETAQSVEEDHVSELEIERSMLPLLPETPLQSPVKSLHTVDGSGITSGGFEKAHGNSLSDIEVVISSKEHFERQQKERQKQEAAKRSAHKYPKETAHESPYFSQQRVGGLRQGERVVAATPLPKKKSPEIVNVDDSD